MGFMKRTRALALLLVASLSALVISGGAQQPLALAAGADATIYGIGTDGDADLDGVNTVPWATLSGSTYTAIRDGWPRRMRVRDGITLNMANTVGVFQLHASSRIYVESTGHISWDGANASGQTGGAAYPAGSLGASVAGGNGGAIAGNGVNGSASTAENPTSNKFQGGAGGAGGGGATGGVGGIANSAGVTRGQIEGGVAGLAGGYATQAGFAMDTCGAGGAGGGGAAASFVGGGGGAGGSCAVLAAPTIVNLNINGITANGGAGAAGAGTDAGGGGSGGGGTIRIWGSLASGSYPPLALPGNGGASGGGNGNIGKTGLPGRIKWMGPDQPVEEYLLDVSALERVTAIKGGRLDISGTMVLGSLPGLNTGTVATSQGGGGFWVYRGLHNGQLVGLHYNASTNVFELYVRGAIELSTAALNTTPVAPTNHNWLIGDTLTWRIWFDPAGGSRSMGIRLVFNDACVGNDTIGTGSGAALYPITSATARGSSESNWRATSDVASGPTTANMTGRVVIIGDSIEAGRLLRPSLCSRLAKMGVKGPIKSVAQGGASSVGGTAPSQLVTWQADGSRGLSDVKTVIIATSTNDLIGGDTAATACGDFQSVVNDVHTNNSSARIVAMQMPPMAGHLSNAQQTIWSDINICISGAGPTPITGVDYRITSHVARMADSHNALRYRGDSSDNLHEDDWGVQIIADEIYANVAPL